MRLSTFGPSAFTALLLLYISDTVTADGLTKLLRRDDPTSTSTASLQETPTSPSSSATVRPVPQCYGLTDVLYRYKPYEEGGRGLNLTGTAGRVPCANDDECKSVFVSCHRGSQMRATLLSVKQ